MAEDTNTEIKSRELILENISGYRRGTGNNSFKLKLIFRGGEVPVAGSSRGRKLTGKSKGTKENGDLAKKRSKNERTTDLPSSHFYKAWHACLSERMHGRSELPTPRPSAQIEAGCRRQGRRSKPQMLARLIGIWYDGSRCCFSTPPETPEILEFEWFGWSIPGATITTPFVLEYMARRKCVYNRVSDGSRVRSCDWRRMRC